MHLQLVLRRRASVALIACASPRPLATNRPCFSAYWPASRTPTEVAGQTARDLAEGERQSAARRMPTLRGSASQLGAVELAALAGALEAAIQQDASAVAAPLAALDDQVSALTAAITSWLGEAAAGATAVAPAATPPPLATVGLAELHEALRTHNIKALRCYEALQPELITVLGEARTAELGRAIRGLRVAEALALLETGGGEGTTPRRCRVAPFR